MGNVVARDTRVGAGYAVCYMQPSCIHQGTRAAQEKAAVVAVALQMHKHSLILFQCQLRTLNSEAEASDVNKHRNIDISNLFQFKHDAFIFYVS